MLTKNQANSIWKILSQLSSDKEILSSYDELVSSCENHECSVQLCEALEIELNKKNEEMKDIGKELRNAMKNVVDEFRDIWNKDLRKNNDKIKEAVSRTIEEEIDFITKKL